MKKIIFTFLAAVLSQQVYASDVAFIRSCDMQDPNYLQLFSNFSNDAVNTRIEICDIKNRKCEKIGQNKLYIIDGTNRESALAKNLGMIMTIAGKKQCVSTSIAAKAQEYASLLEQNDVNETSSGSGTGISNTLGTTKVTNDVY